MTLSQGHFISVPEKGDTLLSFFSIADAVMYDVKNGSKNGYKIQSTKFNHSSEEASTIPETVEWSTYHDYLTQLLNREGFYREVSKILKGFPSFIIVTFPFDIK